MDNSRCICNSDIGVFCFPVSVGCLDTLFYKPHIPEGEYQGALPLNMLSYPFFLDVFHTWRCNPFHLCLKSDETCSGIVSFKIFFANIRVCEINGSFSYPLIIGEAPLNYKINLPFFETKQEFSVFLLSTFTLINLAGAAVGVLTCSTVKRILKSRTFDS